MSEFGCGDITGWQKRRATVRRRAGQDAGFGASPERSAARRPVPTWRAAPHAFFAQRGFYPIRQSSPAT
ncbi:hypothetical protein FFM54_03830 [Burkholderia pseudomallei]|nr:hypothetical protein FFM54_03830 [Burkholderia pseudomallei]